MWKQYETLLLLMYILCVCVCVCVGGGGGDKTWEFLLGVWGGGGGGGGAGRVNLGILVGGVPPRSWNPDPVSDQNMSFSTPVSRPAL